MQALFLIGSVTIVVGCFLLPATGQRTLRQSVGFDRKNGKWMITDAN